MKSALYLIVASPAQRRPQTRTRTRTRSRTPLASFAFVLLPRPSHASRLAPQAPRPASPLHNEDRRKQSRPRCGLTCPATSEVYQSNPETSSSPTAPGTTATSPSSSSSLSSSKRTLHGDNKSRCCRCAVSASASTSAPSSASASVSVSALALLAIYFYSQHAFIAQLCAFALCLWRSSYDALPLCA